MQIVSRGEYNVNGFRNRDLFKYLFPNISFMSDREKSRFSSRITRQIRILRAHKIIRKVSNTHRYLLTKKGRKIISAILKYQNISLRQLNRVAV